MQVKSFWYTLYTRGAPLQTIMAMAYVMYVYSHNGAIMGTLTLAESNGPGIMIMVQDYYSIAFTND